MRTLAIAAALMSIAASAAQGQVGAGSICAPTPVECAVVGCPPAGSGMGQASYMRTPPALRPQPPDIMIGAPPLTPEGTPFIGGPTSPSAPTGQGILSGPPPVPTPGTAPGRATPAVPGTPTPIVPGVQPGFGPGIPPGGLQRGTLPGSVAPVTGATTPSTPSVGAPAPNQPSGSLPSIPPAPVYVPPSPTVPTTISPPSVPGTGGGTSIGIPSPGAGTSFP